MVYGHGINDMPKGWTAENKWNKKVYRAWYNMITRYYSEKWRKIYSTYKDCTVCQRWLLLSNFVDDFKLIEGYDEEKFLNGELELDKDIKSNGANKEYSLENCILVSKSENVRQANKTRDNNYLHSRTGTNHPRAKRVAQYDLDGNLIKIWDYIKQVGEELGINQSHIIACCKFCEIGCNKEEWFRTHKEYPRISCGGYIFKYVEEDDEID